jgi:hypothetical protein
VLVAYKKLVSGQTLGLIVTPYSDETVGTAQTFTLTSLVYDLHEIVMPQGVNGHLIGAQLVFTNRVQVSDFMLEAWNRPERR